MSIIILKHYLLFVFSRRYRRSYRQFIKAVRTAVDYQVMLELSSRVDSSYNENLRNNFGECNDKQC